MVYVIPTSLYSFYRAMHCSAKHGLAIACRLSVSLSVCRHLGKFRMAVSAQRVIRYTSCLVLGLGFQGRRIEWRYFRLHQIQVGGRPPSWIISNGHISATTQTIHLYSEHHAVIFAIAQLSCFLWHLLIL